MSSGGQDGFSFIPRWNEEAAKLESFDQRVRLFVSSTKVEILVWSLTSPGLTQKKTHFDMSVEKQLTDQVL